MKGYRMNNDSDHVNNILIGLIKNDGHCPCDVHKGEDNICPCNVFIGGGGCKCKLYIEDKGEK